MKTAQAPTAARTAVYTFPHQSQRQTALSRFGAMLTLVALALAFVLPRVYAATPDLELPKAEKKMTAVDWSSYSQRLVAAVNSDNDALMQSALRLSIQYADVVNVDDAVIKMMHVYREHSDQNVRRLAAVALASTRNKLALGYLRLSAEYESSPAVKRTLKALTAKTS